MLADPENVGPPEKDDIRKIQSRATKKRGRPSAEADSDSHEEQRSKPKKKASEPRPGFASGILPDSDDEPEESEVRKRIFKGSAVGWH